MFAAASSSSTITLPEIKLRNKSLDNELLSQGLRSINVIGDGNCFFRAISLNLYNNEDEHQRIRKSVVQYLKNATNVVPGITVDLSDKVVLQHLKEMEMDGSWAGDDFILPTAAFLQRVIHIYIYNTNNNSDPLIYSPPAVSNAKPIRLAFYLPGHYKAVSPLADLNVKRR